MVGEFDHVEIVLNNDDGIATVHEFLEHVHQDADVLEVETSGRLVEDVERLARILLGEFGGQFDALALSAAEGSGGLAHLDVAEAHVLDGLDLAQDLRHVLEELHRLVDGHIEHVGD